jgi:hypothetical protein
MSIDELKSEIIKALDKLPEPMLTELFIFLKAADDQFAIKYNWKIASVKS